ncbi:MAG TPA: Hsp20/alpha crystallin family protein [Bordetella sp.]|jgi:HSP20 family molecular chaperone IbpA|nr:Hsp20/alpha crystallin family protein [Bordetella sp.]
MAENRQIVQSRSNPVVASSEANRPQRTPIVPAVDIVENEHGITLYSDLPGVSKTDLNIKVHDGNLYIEAEAVLPAPEGLNLHHAEISEPFYSRSFALSADLDTSKVEAALEDGVLRITVPRREEARPRRIEVSS